MRIKLLSYLMGVAAATLMVVGCEWENVDDTGTWNTRVASWANFSGTYRAVDAGMLVRVGYAAETHLGSSSIASDDATQRSFSGVLTPTVVQGSVFVSDGFESFTDAGTGTGGGTGGTAAVTGNLVGDKGGSGTINYLTGSMSVTFNMVPDEPVVYDRRIGTGDGWQVTFAVTNGLTPNVVPGSVFVSDGKESFTDDAAAPGDLVGDKGGSGTVNYLTGAMSVTFNTEPDVGAPINAKWLTDPGTSQRPAGDSSVWATWMYVTRPDGVAANGILPGSTLPIYSFVVHQLGNKLKIVDNNGSVLDGQISVLQTTAAGEGTTAAGTAVAQFEASGFSGGLPVTIVGTLQGTYVPEGAGGTTTTGGSTLTGRVLDGTWIEVGGKSGSINAAAAASATAATGTTTP